MSHESSNYVYFTKSLMFCWSRCSYPTCLTEVTKLGRFRISLFCISSDPTSVCQSLDKPASFRGFGLELANRNGVFTDVSPIFEAEWRGEVKQNNALHLTRNNSRVWGGDDVLRKNIPVYPISWVVSTFFISWCFITHLKQFPAISRLFIQIKIFLDNIMSFWDAHQAATT